MRQSYLAIDQGPAGNLAMIVRVASGQGHRVAFVGNDRLEGRNPLRPVPDVLIVGGLASFRSEEELEVIAEARTSFSYQTPVVVVADTHYSWARPPAKGKVSGVALVVASPMEVAEAKAFGYDPVVYLGGPPRWQEYAAITPAPIARRHHDSKVILVVGIKDAALTDRMLVSVVVAAVDDTTGRPHCKLIFKPHPNEDEATKDPERRARILGGVKIIETPARTTNLLASVDLTVASGGATDTIAAAYLRAPVIFYEDDDVRQRNEKQIGRPTWFPAEAGACLKAGKNAADASIRSCLEMSTAIKILLSATGQYQLRQRQEQVYPALPTGAQVETKILTFIAELTGKK